MLKPNPCPDIGYGWAADRSTCQGVFSVVAAQRFQSDIRLVPELAVDHSWHRSSFCKNPLYFLIDLPGGCLPAIHRRRRHPRQVSKTSFESGSSSQRKLSDFLQYTRAIQRARPDAARFESFSGSMPALFARRFSAVRPSNSTANHRVGPGARAEYSLQRSMILNKFTYMRVGDRSRQKSDGTSLALVHSAANDGI